MRQRKRELPAANGSVRLCLAPTCEEAWLEIILPWFEQVSSESWRNCLPSLVVVPTRGQANDLKARLIAKNISYLGVQFLTPAGLERLFASDGPTPSVRPEHLRLLLAIAASEISGGPNEPEMLAAKAVARAPASLLGTLNWLNLAGWNFEDLALPSFAPVVQRFNHLVKKCGFVLPGDTHRIRLQEATKTESKFSSLLVANFDGAHWPYWFLLRTAVELATNATVVIEEPRENFFDADLCWIGSWEEIYGEAGHPTKSIATFGDSLFSEAEMRGQTPRTKNFDFLIGTNVSEQAEAIARQCVRYLAADNCTRLGVIFSAGGALSRLVSRHLARLGIPHNDGLGHVVPGIFESEDWLAWVELQQTPLLNPLLRFVNALPATSILFSKIGRLMLGKVLREAYAETLLDDLDILREFCDRSGNETQQAAAEALQGLPLLPSRATLSEFLNGVEFGFRHLAWSQRAFEIANATRDWPQHVDAKFPRTVFLRWLREIALTFQATRSPEGDHPYGSVQLLTVAQAQNQEWSHLIFAGWNDGAWPPAAHPEFARAEQIRAFNQSVRQLNKQAAAQGSQGEGHVSVTENHSLYLGPIEQRAIALRQFDALVEAASECVTVTASLVQEDAPERFWNPSECFTRLFLAEQGEPLTQARLKDLQRATAVLPAPELPPADLGQTLTAFKARRDSSKPAGEYDFAVRADGSYRFTPTLSVSDLEQMVSAPALIWMKRYLNVEAPDDSANPWAAATGKWVHRWLAGIGGTGNGKMFAKFPSAVVIDERVRGAADERRTNLRALCQLTAKTVPDWWNSGWLNALYLARHLGHKIAAAQGWDWLLTEFPIGRDGAVHIADGVEISLRGQIDLVLAQNDSSTFAAQNIWIIDYKTNAAKELKRNDLHDSLVKGTTLQLGLYSLAIHALGAADVSASILSLGVKNVAPQLPVSDLTAHTNIFADLAEMQRTGIFGLKGEIRPAFGYSTSYPLATLPIDSDILEDKWALTHPALVLEKEEWEVW